MVKKPSRPISEMSDLNGSVAVPRLFNGRRGKGKHLRC